MHIITMLFLISILVLIHELGHFGAARMLGIKVEKFGFGLPFGPILYETKWGETKICIHALLLGGYVAFPDDDPDNNLPKDDPSRISNRKVWEKTFVVSAGVIANAFLAYLIVLFVAGFSGQLPSGKYNVFIDEIQTNKTLSANHIGAKIGDKIISANGVIIDSPFKFIEIARRSKKFDGYISYERINEQINRILKDNPNLAKRDHNQLIPLKIKIKLPETTTESPLVISEDAFTGNTKYTPEGKKLTPDQKGLRNSLVNKEYYISDGQASLMDLAVATSDTVHPVDILVNRNGKNVELKDAYPNQDGIIGIKLKSEGIIIPVNGFVSAITESWKYLYKNAQYMVAGLLKILTGQIPLHDLHGIIAITKVGGDIIEKKGLWDGLLLTALISIDLAIVNLLPIPALDGGHLMFLAIEKLRGKPVEEKIQETFAKYGFAFLIGLMILIIFNDIFALVTDKL
ncbi:MAG: site-2 protease family protein [bacterium]